MKKFLILVLMLCLAGIPHAEASRAYHSSSYKSSSSVRTSTRSTLSGYHSSTGSHRHYSSYAHVYMPRSSRAVVGVARTADGRIQRSSASRHSFEAETGYPQGRPGYVIDHIIPLKRGGADDPSNMQWQTKEDAKAKDRWE